MQRQEEEEYQQNAELAARDAAIAAEAEREAAAKERQEKAAAANFQRQHAGRAGASANSDGASAGSSHEAAASSQPYTPGRRSSASLSGTRSSSARDAEAETATRGGGSRVSSSDLSSGSMRNLQQKLAEQMQSAQAAAIRDEEAAVNEQDAYIRFRVPRQYAAPVERAIRIYNDDRTTLYDVLGVASNVDEVKLKKVYRTVALNVHPGDEHFQSDLNTSPFAAYFFSHTLYCIVNVLCVHLV